MVLRHINLIGEQFNSFTNDLDRWKWFLKNKEIFSLALDGDQTIVQFNDDVTTSLSEEEYMNLIELKGFDHWLGDSGGVIDLLTVLNIKCGRV